MKQAKGLTILGMDVGKMVTDGLTGGISSMASSAGMMIAGRALASQGIYLGDQKTAHQLDMINEELQQINETLEYMQADLEQLQNTLDVDVAAIMKTVHETSIITPLSQIENAMVTLCRLTNNTDNPCPNYSIFSPDFKQHPLAATASNTSEQDALKKFAEQMADAINGLLPAMRIIKNTLLNSQSDTGLINNFTDYAIRKLDQGDDRIEDWYLWLERSTLQYIATLNNGMILLANAYSYLFDDNDETAEQAQKFIQQDYMPNILTPIMDQLRASALRMVLSRYKAEVEAPTPDFVTDAQLQNIINRVDLLHFLSTNTSDEHPGIIISRYLRSSQVEFDGEWTEVAKPLTPYGSDSTSRGEVPALSSHYNGAPGSKMKNWYKCIDFNDDNNTMLRSFEDSDIRLGRYHWPFEGTPAAGKPVSDSGIFKHCIVRNYDRRTLKAVDEATDYTVLAALYADANPILKNLVMNSVKNIPSTGMTNPVSPWEYDAFVDPDKKQDADALLKDIHFSKSADSSHYLKLNLKVAKDDGFFSGAGPARYKTKIKRNVHFGGQKKTNIYTYYKATYKADVQQKYQGPSNNMICYDPPTSLDLVLKVNYFSDISKNSDAKDSGGKKLISLQNQHYLSDEHTAEDHYMVEFKPDTFAEFQFRSYITAERQQTVTPKPICDSRAYVEGNWKVEHLRLGWPQPTLNQ